MTHANPTINLHADIPAELAGKRLDQAVALLFPDYSRSRLQQWIKSGELTCNQQAAKTKYIVQVDDHIAICAAPVPQENWAAKSLPLTIAYEDDDVLIINKPAGLVVHPAAGHLDNTLVNALIHYLPSLALLPRAGIIHRLDKDTTGLLIIAKTWIAHTYLTQAMQARKISREYECIVNGLIISGGTIDAPIGRHAQHRIRQAVTPNGKTAITHYRVLEKYRAHTRLQVTLETGRTHQIRVHLSHLHHPLVGDVTYGARPIFPPHPTENLQRLLKLFTRPALHAKKLVLTHPITDQLLTVDSMLPDDLQQLISALQEDTRHDHT